MLTTVIVSKNGGQVAEHQCQSWTQCMEWINGYLTYNDLKRVCADHLAHQFHYVWVKDNESKPMGELVNEDQKEIYEQILKGKNAKYN
jgi:hypothetical protein